MSVPVEAVTAVVDVDHPCPEWHGEISFAGETDAFVISKTGSASGFGVSLHLCGDLVYEVTGPRGLSVRKRSHGCGTYIRMESAFRDGSYTFRIYSTSGIGTGTYQIGFIGCTGRCPLAAPDRSPATLGRPDQADHS